MAKDLQYYYAQLRRIEEHREKSTEKEIRKLYKSMLTDLQHFISDEYVKLAEDGQLTYEILRGKNEYARFLDEVEKRLNGISPKVSKEIRTTVNEMYKLSYDGMVDAVSKSTSSDALRAAFKGVKGATPETIKAAVENPIAGLTLSDTLEKNRRDIIYNIKKQIGIGLTAGDRMSTMARRIADSLDGDYKKAVRVARTEVHRVRETGHNDCVEEIDQTLQNGTTSLRMVKIWRTMKDERVRPQQRVKTKHGWKTVIRGNADHMKMEGQAVLADELFDLGGGLKAKAPGQSGDASNDINCRCTVEYVLMSDEEYFKATGKHFDGAVHKVETRETPVTLENFKEYENEWANETLFKGVNKEDVEYTQEALRQIFDENAYSMRVDAKRMMSIVDNGFKTQFETGRSNGSLAKRERTWATQQLFGVDSSSLKPSDFEKYGYLGSKDFKKDMETSFTADYGSTIVKFRKAALDGRVTYTIDDSLSAAVNMRIVAGEAGSKATPTGIKMTRVQETLDYFKSDAWKKSKDNADEIAQDLHSRYIELQIHGDLSIKDVESVCFTEDDARRATPELLKALKDNDVKVYAIKDWGGELVEL